MFSASVTSQNKSKRILVPALLSAVCALFVALAAVDAWLILAHPLANLPIAGLDRGEAYSALRSYARETSPPDVVLLGSSVVTAPVMQSEAIALGQPFPRMTYRRSTVLERDLGRDLGSEPRVFCLASGGQMVSDAYLVAREMLQVQRPPVAIVYGIAPRDFQDNLLMGIDCTEVFQALAHLDDASTLLNSPKLTFDRKMAIVMSRMWALWRYRADLRTYITLRIKKTMEATLPYVVFDKLGPDGKIKPQRKGQYPEEARGTLKAWPNVALEHLTPEQTKNEYFLRYNPMTPDMVATEKDYLDRLLSLCNQKGVPILLVNMPLSAENMSLMPKGLYAQYLDTVKQACSKYDIDFVDMNSKPWNDSTNFVDTVHLLPSTSAGFLSALSEEIARSRIAVAVKKPRGVIATQSKGAPAF